MKDSQNQTPLTEELFKEIVTDVMTKSYRKGFNDGLDAVVQLIDGVNHNVESAIMKDLMQTITISVLGLKLAERDINGQ